MKLVTLDCATGCVLRYSMTPGWGAQRPTHIAKLPEGEYDVVQAMEGFRTNPSRDQELDRRLPLLVAV